jgi:hypothetical protein
MDWAAGEPLGYHASWSRGMSRWALPGDPPPGMNVTHEAELAIRVVERTDDAYLLRWEPTLVSSPAETVARPMDVSTAAAAVWQFLLTIPLDLSVDRRTPGAAPSVKNAAELHERLQRRERDVLAEAGIPMDCESADAPKVACDLLGTAERSAAWSRQYVSPFFHCFGLTFDADGPTTWTAPHPNPDIGDAVSIDYRRELIDFDPGSSTIQAKTTVQPNAAELQAWARAQMAKLPEGSESVIERVLDQWTFRIETVCTMDRSSGWPIVIEQRTTGGSRDYDAFETVRFERRPDSRAAAAPTSTSKKPAKP